MNNNLKIGGFSFFQEKKYKNIHKQLLYECEQVNINYNIVKDLLKLNANVNIRDKNGYTPLILAVMNNQIAIINLLLTYNPLLDITDNLGRTAFFYACQFNNLEIVKILSTTKMNLNITDKYFVSPFHVACLRGNFNIIFFLLKLKKKNVVYENNLYNQNSNIQNAIIKLKKEHDNYVIDFNIPDINGNTCCHTIAQNSFENILVIISNLVDFENKPIINIDLKNKLGETPFYIAAKLGHSKIIKIFINLNNKLRINYNSINNEGKTPCFIAAENGFTNVIHELSLVNIDMDIPETKYGQTPLFVSSKEGHIDTVIELIKKGSNIHLATPIQTGSFTPFFISIFNKHFDISKLLILNGYIPKKKDFYNKNKKIAIYELETWIETYSKLSSIKNILKDIKLFYEL